MATSKRSKHIEPLGCGDHNAPIGDWQCPRCGVNHGVSWVTCRPGCPHYLTFEYAFPVPLGAQPMTTWPGDVEFIPREIADEYVAEEPIEGQSTEVWVREVTIWRQYKPGAVIR